jgi:hypothetical protein
VHIVDGVVLPQALPSLFGNEVFGDAAAVAAGVQPKMGMMSRSAYNGLAFVLTFILAALAQLH